MELKQGSLLQNRQFALTQKQRRTIVAWTFLLPALLIWIIYRALPMIWNIYLTFFEMSYTGETSFVGFDNYMLLFEDGRLLLSIFNTFVFFTAVPIAIFLALILAVILDRNILGSDIFKSIIFMPYITMMVAVAVIWGFMFTSEGVLNYILMYTGVVEEGIPWLSSRTWARVSIIIVYVWKSVGFYMLIILAGLQDIPRQLYDVSKIDGATALQRFRYITIPLLKPTLGVCALIGLLSSFQLFDLIMVLTERGPGNATEILITWIYVQAFEYGNFGYSAVLTLLLFVIMLIVLGIGDYLNRSGAS